MSAPAVVRLLKGDPDHVRTRRRSLTGDKPKHRRRIRCPKCLWEPGRHDLWVCVCFHSWNTFDTHGVCPSCGLKCVGYMLLNCLKWSRHDDWYDEGPD